MQLSLALIFVLGMFNFVSAKPIAGNVLRGDGTFYNPSAGYILSVRLDSIEPERVGETIKTQISFVRLVSLCSILSLMGGIRIIVRSVDKRYAYLAVSYDDLRYCN
jgi:hypothetical protein